MQLVFHADELGGLSFGQLEDRDAGPHRDDVGDLFLADAGARTIALAAAPLVFELALLLRQLALVVAQCGGLLKLLVFDRGLFLAPRALDVIFELAVNGRSGHRLYPHP